jgi:phage gp29-like protein
VQLTPAAAKASLTAQNDALDSIEQFANDLSDDWKPVTSPVINPIQKALNEASSYEELRRLINEMDLSNDALVESLTNSLFMTHLYGRVNDV